MPPVTERFQRGLALPFAGGRLVAAPYQFVTTGEEFIRIVSANSLTGVRIKVQGLRLSDRGENLPFAYDHIPNSDRSVATTEHHLGVGGLLHLVAFASSGAPTMGQTFVIVQVIRGVGAAAVVLGTLLQGYVTSTQNLGWPGSPIQSSTGGEPTIRAIRGTTPAAATDFLETVPTGARWDLLALRFVMTTSAAAGTRYIGMLANDGVINPWILFSQRTTAPSESRAYNFAQGLNVQVIDATGHTQDALPQPTLLRAGAIIRSTVSGFQAGDQVSAPDYLVREWLEVP